MRDWNRHAFPLSWSNWIYLVQSYDWKIEDNILPTGPISLPISRAEIRTPIANLVTQTDRTESGSNTERRVVLYSSLEEYTTGGQNDSAICCSGTGR